MERLAVLPREAKPFWDDAARANRLAVVVSYATVNIKALVPSETLVLIVVIDRSWK